MRLGIDFGTTRTTVALVDRGNYPLIAFPDHEGDSYEFIPSIAALADRGVVYGFDAQRLATGGAPHVRSFKRLLASPNVTAQTPVRLGDRDIPILDLVTGFLFHVAASVRSSTDSHKDALEVVVGIPAHAHSAQRFLTLEAFRRAGFTVISMINEPSAAGFEYTHRHSKLVNERRSKVLVYDLGGGTFDASVVVAEGKNHEVLASRGNNTLGGDDFDDVLAHLALSKAGVEADDYAKLLLDARDAKEALYPQSRHITLEVNGDTITLPTKEYYEACDDLMEETFRTMEPLLVQDDEGHFRPGDDLSGIYVVGGGSELPCVTRGLKEHFGRRIRRSPYTAGSQAIGLAIAADPEANYSLVEQLSRYFGVFREWDGGRRVTFDPIIEPNASVGTKVSRSYRAAHNLGWYRFAECADLDAEGEPRGEIAPLGELLFPFDPALRSQDIDLENVAVRREEGPLIEEAYTISPNGIISVKISDLESGYSVERSLGSTREAGE
ncbi:Hsp70 family protein [Ancrocorticia populi]|uniref:Hsp70 family protein n=1 Tax=Ancrocorticia populi TaxID=2175228 RepID=UPI0023548D01|nr:Hsp70 family protein [Ancrocorticia populi]